MSKLIFGNQAKNELRNTLQIESPNLILVVATNFIIYTIEEIEMPNTFQVISYFELCGKSVTEIIMENTFYECLSEFNHIISQLDK